MIMINYLEISAILFNKKPHQNPKAACCLTLRCMLFRSFCIFVCLCITACTNDVSKNDPYVGNMLDTSYAGQVTPSRIIYRVNGKGKDVAINQYAGRFIWADYAAFWCSACTPQSRVIKRLHDSNPEKVAFLTIITSVVAGPNESPPDEKAAKDWAGKFNLDPNHVVAATDQWARYVPAHVFYSPEGHTLYKHKGGMTKDQILQVMKKYIPEWEEWKEYGSRAEWML